MGLTAQHTERNGGDLQPPGSAVSSRRTEMTIDEIESAIVRGGGTLEPRTKAVVREFAETILSGYSGIEFELLFSAARISGELHAPQGKRLDGHQYVVHPFEVTLTLFDALGVKDPALLCAALLHDTVEDQPSRLAALSGGKRREWPGRTGDKAEALNVIKDHFGDRIAGLVDKLTNGDFKAMAKSSPEAQRDRFPEHRFYQAHVLELFHGKDQPHQEAFAVKIADFLQNLWGIDRLRELRILDMVDRHEDKRRELSRTIAAEIGDIATSHPLYPVRHRVSEMLSDVLSRMAPVSA